MSTIRQWAQAATVAAIGLALRYRRPIRLMLLAVMMLVLAAASWRFVRGQYWQDKERIVMTFYLLPMYLLALGWAAVMLGQPGLLQPMAVWVDALAVCVAASRTLPNVSPASGHVVFLLYAILVTPHRAYRLLACTYFAATLAIKFGLWHDFVSPVLGGIVAWGLWRLRSSAALKVAC